MTAPAPTRRPGLVTLLVVLVVISGLFSVLFGLLVILLRDNADLEATVAGQGLAGGSSAALRLGILSIVIGLVYLLVAKGLSNGNGLSRLLVAIVSVLNVAAGLWIAPDPVR